MINESVAAQLRRNLEAQHPPTVNNLARVLYNAAIQEATEQQARDAKVRDERKQLHDQRAIVEAGHRTRLDLARKVMDKAHAVFIEACVSLEQERLLCEKEIAPLAARDAELVAMLRPELTTRPVGFEPVKELAQDDREVTAATKSQGMSGIDWIDPHQILPGLPTNMGPQAKPN
jgi:hypothetical protein